MNQGKFFFERIGGVIPFDPPVAPLEEKVRLSKQAQRVLTRLSAGPATNRELSQIALSYRRRVCDLKEAGHQVEIIHKGKGGLNTYALKSVHHLS